MDEAGAIILAAGLSHRMGKQNKLLMPINGVPMIKHVVKAYRMAVAGRIVVVMGHQADQIEAALAGSRVETVFNEDYAQGQPTSVSCGLRAAGKADVVLIGLGDQPLLTAADITSLLAAHFSADSARISIPQIGQQRGNPIVVPANLRAKLLRDPKSPGCKKFTRNHPEHVQFHELASPGFYADVDTPEAYAALAAGKLEYIT